MVVFSEVPQGASHSSETPRPETEERETKGGDPVSKYSVQVNGAEVGRYSRKREAVSNAGIPAAMSKRVTIENLDNGDCWTVTHDGRKAVLTPA